MKHSGVVESHYRQLGLVDFEFVGGANEFCISVNGITPSECVGYSVNPSGCFVFHLEGSTVMSVPIPDAFRSLVDGKGEILFVRFKDGEIDDALPLKRVAPAAGEVAANTRKEKDAL